MGLPDVSEALLASLRLRLETAEPRLVGVTVGPPDAVIINLFESSETIHRLEHLEPYERDGAITIMAIALELLRFRYQGRRGSFAEALGKIVTSLGKDPES